MIHQLIGTVRDLAGHIASQVVDVEVTDGLVPTWGAKILDWIQPMPSSVGPKFYAAPWGSDISGTGRADSPWRSLAKANSLQPGDTLVLRGGGYGAKGSVFTWSRAGTPSNPVTIEGYPGERPIVEGKVEIAGPWQRWARTYFKGPTGNVGGPGPNGEANFVNLDGPHLELLNCEIAYAQWHAGVSGSDASDYRILGCYIHDNGGPNGDYTDPSQDNTSHGLYLSPSSFGLVANCLIEHNDAKGLMGRHSSHHLMIVHNTIVANGRYGSNQDDSANTWVYANNIFMENARVKGGQGLSTDGAPGPFWNIRNVFWRNGTNLNSHYDTDSNVTVVAPKVADPLFVKPALYTPQQDPAPNWDHHIKPGSPAIGYGDPDYAVPFDIEGKPRIGRFDCGAYQAA
ncbi:MAG TPA: right-handed parallel beta-helix repeat-containing protein [Candidatus Krumholzibacteria bacterium]|nr:right-handed parallel beta-helix repeat-containing protein [Candidatus Krumholzibacteria bacterium]